MTPNLRLVGTIACVAFGRPAPSSVVNFALNSSRPRAISAGSAARARRGDGVEVDDETAKTRSSQLPPKAAPASAQQAKPAAMSRPDSLASPHVVLVASAL